MRIKVVMLVVLAGVLLAVAYRIHTASDSLPPQATAVSQPAKSSAAPLTQAALFEKVARQYRLRPDKRLLAAIGAIDSFYGGKESTPADAVFEGGEWQIRHRNELVGKLTELPDFDAQMQLLIGWAKQKQERAGVKPTEGRLALDATQNAENDLQAFFGRRSAQAAERLGQLWVAGNREARVLAGATRALLQLQLQQLDSMQLGESLPAQTWALLAITRAMSGVELPAEESLIAFELGYSAHAAGKANQLAESSAVRAYVLRQDKVLRNLVEHSQASAMDRYLYLLLLAETNRPLEWERALTRWFAEAEDPLPLAKTALLLCCAFDIRRSVAPQVPRLVALGLANETGAGQGWRLSGALVSFMSTEQGKNRIEGAVQELLAPRASTVVRFVEGELGTLESRFKGPFLPGKTYGDYFRGYLYSGLDLYGRHLVDQLSSAQAAQEYLTQLGDGTEPVLQGFRRWYGVLAESEAGGMEGGRLQKALDETSALGVAAMTRLLTEQKKYLPYGSPAFITGTRSVMAALDWRPAHRAELSDLAHRALLDPRLSETMAESAVAVDPARTETLTVYLARSKRNAEVLRRVADTGTSSYVRTTALHALHKLSLLSEKDLAAAYQRLAAEYPDDPHVVETLIEVLMRQRRYADARNAANAWLNKNVRHPSLWPVTMREHIAKAYRLEGRLSEAWAMAEVAAASYKGSAMREAALVLQAQEKWEAAEEMMRREMARYPNSMSLRAELARLLWRRDQPDKAADILAQREHPANVWVWKEEYGEAFVAAYRDKSDDHALKAFGLLLQRGVPHEHLFELASVMGTSGRPGLAVAMIEPLRYGGLGQLYLFVRQYQYQRKAEGEGQALAALRQRIPAQMLNPLSVIAYGTEEYDLLWSAIENPETGQSAEAVWLMRAAAALLLGDAARLQAAKSYFNAHPAGHYQTLGRYLTDQATDAEVLQLINSPKRECEVSYFLGLRAQARGDLDLAAKWYRVTLETLSSNDGEYRWAFDQLMRWRDTPRADWNNSRGRKV